MRASIMKYFLNLSTMLLLFFLSFSLIYNTANGKKLLLVQVIFRHGERVPTKTYPNDPYKDHDWGVPLGNLTKHGIQQQVELGKALRERYMIKKRFLSKTYKSSEIIARSTDVNRTIESARANLRGLYKTNDISKIPIHTTFFDIPVPWLDGKSCPKYTNLITAKRASYEDIFYNKHKGFINFLQRVSGFPKMAMNDVNSLFNTLLVQKYLKCKLPKFLKTRHYYKMKYLSKQIFRFQSGLPAFGLPEDLDLMKFKEGPLLKHIIDNFDMKLNIYKRLKSMKGLNTKFILQKLGETTKFISYSAHDYTIMNLLTMMSLQKYVLDDILKVPFASTLFYELYENNKGKHEIKILYSKKRGKKVLDVTDQILGCGRSKVCLYDDFKKAMQDRIPKNVYVECLISQNSRK
uniref:acid phosphatase n=1 Tax=Strongyloides venezuelensis TaxID=75913 RepID=A0A0K0FPH7_STRVS